MRVVTRAPSFAEFVATLSADDAELQRDLKSAEAQTKASATKMQGNLDKVSISAQGAGQALSTLGQGAAAMGGQMGGAVGQGIAFTQMVGQMGVKMGLVITSFVALAAAVVIYRKEIADAILVSLEWVGVIEDITAKQSRLDTVAKDLENRLKVSQARSGIRGAASLAQERLDAVRSGGAAALAELDLQAQVQAQLNKLAGAVGFEAASREAIEFTLRTRLQINKELENEKKLKADIAAADVKAAQEVDQRLSGLLRGLEDIRKSRQQAAEALAVGVGIAKPSDFIDDPILKRIAQIGELFQQQQQPGPTPTTGTFGLREISSPLAAIRGGEVLGRQQLTTAEQHKNIAEKQLKAQEQANVLLSDLKGGTDSTGAAPLFISGGA